MSSTYGGNPASFPSLVTIPGDGDPRNASSVNVPFEALADRTAYLKQRLDPIILSNLALVQFKTIRLEDPGEAETGHGVTVSVAAWTSFGGFTSPPTVNTLVGDVVETVVQGHARLQDAGAGGSRGWVRFAASQNGGGDVAVPGAKQQIGQDLASGVLVVPFMLQGLDIVTAAGLYVGSLQGRVDADASASLDWIGAYSVTYKVWRPQ